MCQFKSWYHNEETGFVVQCTHCGQIQIGYGMFLLNFNEQEFEGFRKMVLDFFCSIPACVNRKVKNISLPTPAECINLLFSYNELKELHLMIEFSDNEMKADGLMRCFNESDQ